METKIYTDNTAPSKTTELPPIQSSLRELEGTIESIHDIVDDLHGRLDPILVDRSSLGQNEEGQPDPPPQSDIRNHIGIIDRKAIEVKDSIQYILDRIEC